jgi:hypothetical protein
LTTDVLAKLWFGASLLVRQNAGVFVKLADDIIRLGRNWKFNWWGHAQPFLTKY